MDFLQKYLFIPLDIFKKSQQNRNIAEKKDAWLILLSCDEPEMVIKLIERYPEFRKMYEEGYEICLNTERVMEMFSKELYELDKNTVQYMIDEMQDTIDVQKEEMDKMQKAHEKELEETLEKTLGGTVNILRSLGIPDHEIVRKISGQYGLDEKRVQKFLAE